jgi:hypothetical protein
MDRNREKMNLQGRLASCRLLASEFPCGPTAEMIRDMEEEISEQLRQIDGIERLGSTPFK